LDNLKNFLKKIQSDKRFKDFDEAAIKQAIVLKILSLLEWDPFNLDEVQPEYRLKKGKVDFALKHEDSIKAFLSVKKDLDNFKEYIEMLLNLSAQYNVEITVYTNGLSWWFFLPLIEGSVDDKIFCMIDMQKEKIEAIVKKFSDFLLKENILSDNVTKLAGDICNNRKEEILINEHLPKAWEKVMNEPEKWLVDVISEVTEELCGYRPDKEKVKEFVISERKIQAEKSAIVEMNDTKKVSDKVKKDYKGKSVKSFRFKDEKHNVKSWQEIPWKLCDILSKKHKDSFDTVLWIILNGRDFFSRDPHQFLMSKNIPNADIYINIDLSEKIAMALTNEILSNFGYKESDLIINTE
jgi:hypothetical protein